MTERDVVVILREWRDEFALAHGYHLAAMVKTLRALDRAAGDRLIRGEPRRPSAGVVAVPSSVFFSEQTDSR